MSRVSAGRFAEREYRKHDVRKEEEQRRSSSATPVSRGNAVHDDEGQYEPGDDESQVTYGNPKNPPT